MGEEEEEELDPTVWTRGTICWAGKTCRCYGLFRSVQVRTSRTLREGMGRGAEGVRERGWGGRGGRRGHGRAEEGLDLGRF